MYFISLMALFMSILNFTRKCRKSRKSSNLQFYNLNSCQEGIDNFELVLYSLDLLPSFVLFLTKLRKKRKISTIQYNTFILYLLM